jgi:hypothetical protein
MPTTTTTAPNLRLLSAADLILQAGEAQNQRSFIGENQFHECTMEINRREGLVITDLEKFAVVDEIDVYKHNGRSVAGCANPWAFTADSIRGSIVIFGIDGEQLSSDDGQIGRFDYVARFGFHFPIIEL